MLPTSENTKARMFSVVQLSSAKVAPLTTTASPSAMMMKRAQRSAIWPPSTAQASSDDGPNLGTQNRAAGETYSMMSAMIHSHNLVSPSARPPRIQNTAEVESQARMRMAL